MSKTSLDIYSKAECNLFHARLLVRVSWVRSKASHAVAMPKCSQRLAAGHVMMQANVFVVGDPDQAIYGWRGANVINMQQSFDNDYPGSCFGPLTLNYS